MSPLAWIIVASLSGAALSIVAAAAITFTARAGWIPLLISYAIGALLGAVFLETLPEALAHGKSPQQVTMIVLLGIVGFFILEKLVLWRHCHVEHCEAHDPPLPPVAQSQDHSRSGLLIMIGDTFHNFVDGVLIAAAFMANINLGIVTSIAIIAHEIPQEVGDFLILLHSGYSKARAFLFNLLSSAATLVGAVLAYFTLQGVQDMVPPLLAVAAASMIYVAVADLIPDLHKRPELGATAQQVLLIALGIGSIWLVGELLPGHAH